MKIYVSFDGDHIGRMVGRASLADKPEEVSRIAQAIDRGNRIWSSWAESHGGKVINIGGDEGRLLIEADWIEELPSIRTQYEDCVGSTVSVGVGTRLSESDKALMAAKVQGGDRIQLFTEEVEEILAKLKDKTEAEKLQEEYLDPEAGLNKAQPGMNHGSNAGFAGASRSHPAAPAAPTEGSEHSEAEVARSVNDGRPTAELTHAAGDAADLEQQFHQLAGSASPEQASKPTGLSDDIRTKIVKILGTLKGKGDQLAQLKQADPELYASVKGLLEGMIDMARSQEGQGGQEGQAPQEAEEMEKAALSAGKTGRHNVVLPVGSQIDSGPSSNHEGGELKVRDPETGKTKWRQVRAGLVMAPDGTPTSSRNPGG